MFIRSFAERSLMFTDCGKRETWLINYLIVCILHSSWIDICRLQCKSCWGVAHKLKPATDIGLLTEYLATVLRTTLFDDKHLFINFWNLDASCSFNGGQSERHSITLQYVLGLTFHSILRGFLQALHSLFTFIPFS